MRPANRNSLPASASAVRRVPGPLGELVVAASRDGLVGIWFADRIETGDAGHGPGDDPRAEAVAEATASQLIEYFAGDRKAFDVPLVFEGTGFQREVWRELARIGFGETSSYGEVAERIGRPKAVRAVGLAVGANPITIIVPCHRVVGADGSLTGFGGGLDRKRWLLGHEGALEPTLV